ncbi:MAG: trehalase family glycosidase [Bacteroidota bacterium]
MKQIILTITFLITGFLNLSAQKIVVPDSYFNIVAMANSPLYTTYAASMERSRLYGDKAYKMDYYSDCMPLNYSSEQAGKMFSIWKINGVVADRIGEFYRKPMVLASFPDMAVLEYEPYAGLNVQEIFLVYSSTLAYVDLNFTNKSDRDMDIEIYPVLQFSNSGLEIKSFDKKNNCYLAQHNESLNRYYGDLSDTLPYPTEYTDVFGINFPQYSYGGYKCSFEEFHNTIKTNYNSLPRVTDSLNLLNSGAVDFISLHYKVTLKPGENRYVRYYRGCIKRSEKPEKLLLEINGLKMQLLQKYVDNNIKEFAKMPTIRFHTDTEKLLFLSSINLARGCMLPAEGKTKNNYYVFSRNPIWGWGHGSQSQNESLSMLTYAFADPMSAENSQKVYMEQQDKHGFIPYRNGPRGPETYEKGTQFTTSAPFFNWTNWEIFRISKNEEFLEQAYDAGESYMEWLTENRDTDGDGLFEWGPNGLIESVRDWYNAAFQITNQMFENVEKEDIANQLECLDLNFMIIHEMRSLSKMAKALGKNRAGNNWTEKADKLSELVNKFMWDDSTNFYYNINKTDHSFKYKAPHGELDLRRMEIIGFLALWAEAAPKDRAEKILKHLTNPAKFWRKNGIPSLAADDKWYSPNIDYCCRWNGPVWLTWNYMVYNGLMNYGYKDVAKQLSDKMMQSVITQLSKNHNFWESYSPDNDVLNSPPNMITGAIMGRLIMDGYNIVK